MKISSIITTGGTCLIASGIFLLFSCDSTQSLTANGKQTLSYSLHKRGWNKRVHPRLFLKFSTTLFFK